MLLPAVVAFVVATLFATSVGHPTLDLGFPIVTAVGSTFAMYMMYFGFCRHTSYCSGLSQFAFPNVHQLSEYLIHDIDYDFFGFNSEPTATFAASTKPNKPTVNTDGSDSDGTDSDGSDHNGTDRNGTDRNGTDRINGSAKHADPHGDGFHEGGIAGIFKFSTPKFIDRMIEDFNTWAEFWEYLFPILKVDPILETACLPNQSWFCMFCAYFYGFEPSIWDPQNTAYTFAKYFVWLSCFNIMLYRFLAYFYILRHGVKQTKADIIQYIKDMPKAHIRVYEEDPSPIYSHNIASYVVFMRVYRHALWLPVNILTFVPRGLLVGVSQGYEVSGALSNSQIHQTRPIYIHPFYTFGYCLGCWYGFWMGKITTGLMAYYDKPIVKFLAAACLTWYQKTQGVAIALLLIALKPFIMFIFLDDIVMVSGAVVGGNQFQIVYHATEILGYVLATCVKNTVVCCQAIFKIIWFCFLREESIQTTLLMHANSPEGMGFILGPCKECITKDPSSCPNHMKIPDLPENYREVCRKAYNPVDNRFTNGNGKASTDKKPEASSGKKVRVSDEEFFKNFPPDPDLDKLTEEDIIKKREKRDKARREADARRKYKAELDAAGRCYRYA